MAKKKPLVTIKGSALNSTLESVKQFLRENVFTFFENREGDICIDRFPVRGTDRYSLSTFLKSKNINAEFNF